MAAAFSTLMAFERQTITLSIQILFGCLLKIDADIPMEHLFFGFHLWSSHSSPLMERGTLCNPSEK
jgi:hypothetical protein